MQAVRALVSLTLALGLMGTPAAAADNDAAMPDDPQAALERAHRGGGPKTLQAEMTMTLIDSGGKTAERRLEIRREGEDKQLVWFTYPASMRGTGFLRVAEDGEQKIWLWLPSFKKLERIGAAKENRSFLGSDFTYADMADRRLGRFSHKRLGEAKLDDGTEVVKFESVLQEKDSDAPYGKIVSFVSQATGRLLREDLFDRKGDLVKRKLFKARKEIDGTVVPTVIEMHDLQRDHKTRIEMNNIKLNEEIPSRTFTTQNLKRLH